MELNKAIKILKSELGTVNKKAVSFEILDQKNIKIPDDFFTYGTFGAWQGVYFKLKIIQDNKETILNTYKSLDEFFILYFECEAKKRKLDEQEMAILQYSIKHKKDRERAEDEAEEDI